MPRQARTAAYDVAAGSVEKAVPRNPAAKYWIPTGHEWYKAAYYKGGSTRAGYWSFATRSNTPPKSILSATGANHANYQWADRTNGLTPVGLFAGLARPLWHVRSVGQRLAMDRQRNLDRPCSSRAARRFILVTMPISLRATNRFNSELSFQYSGLGFRVAGRALPARTPCGHSQGD